MKKFTKKTFIFFLCFALKNLLPAQCGSPFSLGSANNMFGMARNNTNPVTVDKTLNAAIFIHRHNTAQFGGNTGNLRYDISTNGGANWTLNQGVLNPSSGNTNSARYPQATIYNPPGNATPTSAYLGYMAATTNVNSSLWNGVVTGMRQLNGTGNTETYNQPSSPSYLVTSSLVKGAPGVYWAVNETSNGTNQTGGIIIYKGVWNGVNAITWSTNTVFYPQFDLSYSGLPFIGETNIAFDPSGNIGWICVMGHLTSGPSNYGYYPLFYKSINGGASWSGPTTVNLSQFSCIASNVSPGLTPAAHFMADLTVDVNGNPHLLTTVGNGDDNYGIDENMWHHMFDLTQNAGTWTAHDVANVNGAAAVFYGSITNDPVRHAYCPQVSRSADGSKIFFGWADNSNYSLGAFNTNPNLFARGFDVQQNKWTQVKDFSSCNGSTAGKIFYPHLAAEVLEPTAAVYKLAPVYAEFVVTGDPESAANFKFLDNATFNGSDFSVNLGAISVNIQPAFPLLCPGSSINLSVTGSFSQIFWSNGNTNAVNQVNSAGQHIVTVQSGCNVASDTVIVKTVTLNAGSDNLNICQGAPVTLTVAGNAYSYTWTPGTLTGTTVTVFPNVSTTYIVTASGDQNCTTTRSLNVLVNPCTGIEVNKAGGNHLSVYPNPNNGTMKLRSETDITLKLVNELGQCVKTFSLDKENNHEVSLTGLSKGVYFISGLGNSKEQISQKIIVE